MISNTKPSRNLAKMLLVAVFLTSTNVFSQTIIPMPIFYGSGGNMEINDALGMLIAINIIMLIIYIVRSIMWIFKKDDYSYYEYVIFSDFEFITPDVTSFFFTSINGIALLIWMASFISTLL